MGIKKVYTASIVLDGKIRGSMVCKVWFWVSAYKAYDLLLDGAEAINSRNVIFDFRKV